MSRPLKYNDEIEKDIRIKINEIQQELPKFCRNYFISLETTTLPRTRFLIPILLYTGLLSTKYWKKRRIS